MLYALLAERAEEADNVQRPVFLAAGVKAEEVDDVSHRGMFDAALLEATAEEKAAEDALLRFLGVGQA